MRTLSLSEQLEVSGGLEEVIVSDSKLSLSASVSGFVGGGSGPTMFTPDGGGLDEVSVTAHKLTEQEKLAWDLAKARAEANLLLAETAIVGGSVAFGLGSSKAVQTLLSVLGFHAGTKYTAEERARVLERMTETEFMMDGMDGSHDGFVYYQSPFFVIP